MEHAELARSFMNIGSDYERYRPGFPAEALDLIDGLPVADALDLGAGTGKLTRMLVDVAERVTAVDPSEAMLDELRSVLPHVPARVGAAEAIPLASASQDLVTVAQAFHWFDEDRACDEIARVLRPRGTLALLWNVRSPLCSWDLACEVIAHPDSDGIAVDHSVPPVLNQLPRFEPVSSARVHWSEQITRADYLNRWLTVSTLIAADLEHRRELIRKMEHVLDSDAETAGRSMLSLRQVTEVLVYRRD